MWFQVSDCRLNRVWLKKCCEIINSFVLSLKIYFWQLNFSKLTIVLISKFHFNIGLLQFWYPLKLESFNYNTHVCLIMAKCSTDKVIIPVVKYTKSAGICKEDLLTLNLTNTSYQNNWNSAFFARQIYIVWHSIGQKIIIRHDYTCSNCCCISICPAKKSVLQLQWRSLLALLWKYMYWDLNRMRVHRKHINL